MSDAQVLYDGRWVSREHFRAFVYSKNDKKLANSYDEFSNLISSGIWFADKPEEKVFSDDNVVDIKPKRGRPCRNQLKV